MQEGEIHILFNWNKFVGIIFQELSLSQLKTKGKFEEKTFLTSECEESIEHIRCTIKIRHINYNCERCYCKLTFIYMRGQNTSKAVAEYGGRHFNFQCSL